MKIKNFFIASFFAGSLLIGGCQNKQQTTTQDVAETDTARPVVEAPAKTEVTLNPQLQQLLGEGEGLFRGTSLGDALTDVKARERAEPFETSVRHVGYTLEFSNLESADILYYHAPDGRIEKITADLFLNSRPSVEKHKKELVAWFASQYGAPATEDSVAVWTAPNARITLKDVSRKKDFGLKLTFAGVGETVTVQK